VLTAQEGPSAWLLSQHKSNVIIQVCPLCFIAHASPYYPMSLCWCWELFILATEVLYLMLKSKLITMMHRF